MEHFFWGGAGEVAGKALKLKRPGLRAARVARRKRPRRRFCFLHKAKIYRRGHVKRNASKKHVKKECAQKKYFRGEIGVKSYWLKPFWGQSAPLFCLGGVFWENPSVAGNEWCFGQYAGHVFAGGRPLAAFYIAVFLFWLK